MCDSFLIFRHKNEIINILKHTDKHKCFSININFLELSEFDKSLAQKLLTNPEDSLKEWEHAVTIVQHNLSKEAHDQVEIKRNVTCRIHTLYPESHIIESSSFPGNEDANKFIQISGTVVRMSERKLLEFQRQYICVKCKYSITVEAEYDKRNIIKMPKICNNPAGCTCKTILSVSEGQLNSYDCRDYQEIKLQEDLSKLRDKTGPNTLTVTLENDLVNVCKPGENVIITGIVKRRWSEFEKGVKIIVDIVLQANHIQICNKETIVFEESKHLFKDFWTLHQKDELIGRNIILKSIAPELYGLHLVKLAIAIVLAGGCHYEENETPTITGMHTRSDSHLLLVGDPGTGKSQMLKFASQILPRSVLTTGIGSTSSGLTVAAIMEGGEWQLEAGALVMSDGGICCIDEFNTMKEHDRTSIHEAMEQQTISVAKAGLVCKLKTRCSILAACNPKGNIDVHQPLCINVAMSSPLLSRFDLLFLLRDVVHEEQDRKLAEYQLQVDQQINNKNEIWDINKLKEYYILIRQFKPKLSNDAETILSTYYQLQRKFCDRNMSRTTVRLLESLIRLSQGHAKLLFHSQVEVIDAIFAIILVDTSLDYNSSILHLKVDNNSFLNNPNDLYMELLSDILRKLNLEQMFENKTGNSQGCTTQRLTTELERIESQFVHNKNSIIHQSPDQINRSVAVNEKCNASADSGYESKFNNDTSISPSYVKETESNITKLDNNPTINDGVINSALQYVFNESKSLCENSGINSIGWNSQQVRFPMADKQQKIIESVVDSSGAGASGFRSNPKFSHVDNLCQPMSTSQNGSRNNRQQLSQKYQNMKDLDDLLSDGDDSFKNIIRSKPPIFTKNNSFKSIDMQNVCNNNEADCNNKLKGKRHSTSSTIEDGKKEKLVTDTNAIEILPSINDDFLNFNIDLDFQYISHSSTSSQKLSKPIINRKHEKDTKTENSDKLKDIDEKKHETYLTKTKKKCNPYLSMLSKYQFVPPVEHDAKEKRDQDEIINEYEEVEAIKKNIESANTIEQSQQRNKDESHATSREDTTKHQSQSDYKKTGRSDSATVIKVDSNKSSKRSSPMKKTFKFKRLNSVLNMAMLDEDIENFEIPEDWQKFSIKKSQSNNSEPNA